MRTRIRVLIAATIVCLVLGPIDFAWADDGAQAESAAYLQALPPEEQPAAQANAEHRQEDPDESPWPYAQTSDAATCWLLGAGACGFAALAAIAASTAAKHIHPFGKRDRRQEK